MDWPFGIHSAFMLRDGLLNRAYESSRHHHQIACCGDLDRRQRQHGRNQTGGRRRHRQPRVAHDTSSHALAADALHFASDVFGSLAVLIGLGLSAFGFLWGDAAAAIGVAIMISVLGLRLGRSTVETLLDRAPEGASEKAKTAIRAVPGVVGIE